MRGNISKSSEAKFIMPKRHILPELPEVGNTRDTYVIPVQDNVDVYTEYMFDGEKFIPISQFTLDLSSLLDGKVDNPNTYVNPNGYNLFGVQLSNSDFEDGTLVPVEPPVELTSVESPVESAPVNDGKATITLAASVDSKPNSVPIRNSSGHIALPGYQSDEVYESYWANNWAVSKEYVDTKIRKNAKEADTTGGTADIANSTVKGYNNSGVVYGRRISATQLCVASSTENGISIIGDIEATYDNTDPDNRAKGTFVYNGSTHSIANVGDFAEIRTALSLSESENIYLKIELSTGTDGIDVGMPYHLCYPRGTKLRYGKVVSVLDNKTILVNNEVTGIDRYFKLYGIPNNSDGDYYGSIVVDGGEVGEFKILKAEGLTLHIEGEGNFSTIGGNVRGCDNKVKQPASASDGEGNINSGYGSRTSGVKNDVSGDLASADGELNKVLGYAAHADGSNNDVSGNYANGSGYGNEVIGDYSDGGGAQNILEGTYGFLRGYKNKLTKMAGAVFGALCEVLGDYGFAVGYKNKVTENSGAALGIENESNGIASFVTGRRNKANTDLSFVTGQNNIADKVIQAIFGRWNAPDSDDVNNVLIVGWGSDENNRKNIFTVSRTGKTYAADDIYSKDVRLARIDELIQNLKDGQGQQSVKFGGGTSANGQQSIAGGINSEANARRCVAIGQWVLANSDHQAVFGTFNIPDEDGLYRLIIGNGSSDNNRSNAFTVDKNGNGVFDGKVAVGSDPVNDMDVVTLKKLNSVVGDIETALDDLITRQNTILGGESV